MEHQYPAFPEIDPTKLMKLREDMLQAQAESEKAQQKYWQAETEFNCYVRYGDTVGTIQNAQQAGLDSTLRGAVAGY